MKILNWLATQLFGAKVGNAFSQLVNGKIAYILTSDSSLSLAAVLALVNKGFDSLATQALTAAKVPSWAAPFLNKFLEAGLDAFVTAEYKNLTGKTS